MTKFQALYVKFLRVRCGGSWRWVDGQYNRRYVDKEPFDDTFTTNGNQITGMMLCDVAMKLLENKTEDGWN